MTSEAEQRWYHISLLQLRPLQAFTLQLRPADPGQAAEGAQALRVTKHWWRPQRGHMVSKAKWQDLPSVARELDLGVEWTIALWRLRSDLLALPQFPPEVVAVSKLLATERILWSPGAEDVEEDYDVMEASGAEEDRDVDADVAAGDADADGGGDVDADVAAAHLLAARLAQRRRAPAAPQPQGAARPPGQAPVAAEAWAAPRRAAVLHRRREEEQPAPPPPAAPAPPPAAEPPGAAAVLHRRRQQCSVPVCNAEGRAIVANIHHVPRADGPGDCYVRCIRCQARATRTLAAAAEGREGRRYGQGRPLVFLAWWGAFDCEANADRHRRAGPHPDHALRAAAREALKGDMAYLELTGLERPRAEGEGSEPEYFPAR